MNKKEAIARGKKSQKKQDKINLNNWKLLVKKRDEFFCQMCGKDLSNSPRSQHAHHILPNMYKYKMYHTDIQNGILLCPYCHKFSPNSPHLNAFYFHEWMRVNKPTQYFYLLGKLVIEPSKVPKMIEISAE